MAKITAYENKVLEYIKTHEIFWLKDLINDHGITDYDSNEYTSFSRACIKLHNKGIIMACERKGNSIQYLRV